MSTTDAGAVPTYEIHAVRYARVDRERHQNFIMTEDLHEQMPLDFFVWAIVGNDQTIVVDTGFGPEEAARRGRELRCTPAAALGEVGVDATAVRDVIVTHLHYDHAGTTDDFSSATFHLQDKEIAYATGRHMTTPATGHAYAVEDVVAAVRLIYGNRVRFHDGDAEIAPGINVHYIGGHTAGLQCVSVNTERGTVVLASDASHFYENMEKRSPFPIVADLTEMLRGYDRLDELATSPDHIIPGHDPLVLQLYPPSIPGSEDAVRVDSAPTQAN